MESRRARFSLPESNSSSRSSSPAPDDDRQQLLNDTTTSLTLNLSPGNLSSDVYDASLSWWRAGIRRAIVRNVKRESEIIARIQDTIRTPWLDSYFVYTSTLGTHTFFLIFLPAIFFFGHEAIGHSLLMLLALGVYAASFLKDLFCAPRPFAPPVTRLIIGNYHLEYGFPSTHSTNSVSIALLLFSHIYVLASTPTPTTIIPSDTGSFTPDHAAPALSHETFLILSALLAWYAFSIVFGRIYTAMHSFSDCIMGIIIGTALWWADGSFPGFPIQTPAWLLSLFPTLPTTAYLFEGLQGGDYLDSWIRRGGWEVPFILTAVALLAVNQHPVPVDDCPCFEEAIAFISVILGACLGRWGDSYWGISARLQSVIMPGSGWKFQDGIWLAHERTWSDSGLWWGTATIKMAFGILVIFVWRIVAKSTLHLILPPIYRLFAKAIALPTRRFYTPATDYKSVPSEFVNANGLSGLRSIPSVIDLSAGGVGEEVGGIGSGFESSGGGIRGITSIKLRNKGSGFRGENGYGPAPTMSEKEVSMENLDSKGEVKHYDADVLTKVIVYAGIALLATQAIPTMFNLLGLGVRSWPAV